ncbi:MAG: alpha/beta hydrolase [Planctomycetes bacterium HGW-Planctomycetes-1]|nr:MAG: alpha/beta hydrolase [Planctomycetes bacterium HGW-Planctomycetes-1]
MKKVLLIIVVISALFSSYCNAKNFIVPSSDGQLISYNVFGKGDITLVFVHGWSCDSRYWRCQISYFSKKYRVVTVDLAGHGNSEQNREVYTLEAFGQDVKAVVEDVNARKVILIGHSFAGEIAAEAARLMPERVIGIIGADSIQNVEDTMPKEQFKQMVDGFQKDFKGEVKNFAGLMLGNLKPELKKWIVDDMSCEPSYIAISAFKEYVEKFENKGIANIFKEVKVPVRCVNADLWPTNPDANRKYMSSFEVTYIKGAGHFVMLERPREFNIKLNDTIKEIIKINKSKTSK